MSAYCVISDSFFSNSTYLLWFLFLPFLPIQQDIIKYQNRPQPIGDSLDLQSISCKNVSIQQHQLMEEQKLLIDKPQIHRSTIHISLLAWNTAISFFHFGYYLVYLGAIPFSTILKIYTVDINRAVAQGLLNGCIPVGALIGAAGSSLIIRRFSRKNNIHLTNAITFVTGFLIYIPNFYLFMLFRLIQGICVGIYCSLIPMTVRQFAPTALSGRLGTFPQLNVSLGVVFAYLVTYTLKKITGDLNCESFWFLVFGVPQIAIIIQTVLLIFVFPYDTPKYLLSKGRQDEAREVLWVIYKQQYVEQILQEKQKQLNQSSTVRSSQIQTIVDEPQRPVVKQSRLAFMMAVHVAVAQQFSGVNAINVYCGPILEKATSSVEVALFIPTLLGMVKFSGTIMASVVISRFGRKTLIEVGALLLTLACVMMAVGFGFQSDQETQFQIMIIAGMFIFIGSFGLTLGPLAWICISEMVEPKYIPFATAINWVASSSVIIMFPIIKDNFLNGNPYIAFTFFGSCCFITFVISRMFMLETKDKTQREIRQEYAKHKFKLW